ncbi:tetratricopeptide repeat protein [Pedobacter arcticus]|uniref:tetratricopeptide repeat protein n=1 Tax=Pedobacter arcticus TaxID=752140 RepID=UPI0012B52CFE|nr:tetratricopeptide repeat protein [Pedobacter arcticus]
MKKTILSMLLVSFFFAANAQKSEISAAKNNYALYEVGMQTKTPMKKQLETLKLAKESTDKAVENSKTANNAELWAYRSLILSSISVTDTVNKANASSAFDSAQEAITKAKTLDGKKEYAKITESAEKNLSIMMQNRGVAAFNKKDYKEAYKSFKFIADVMPEDSLFNMYTAIAANSSQMYDEAIKYYKQTIKLNPKNPGLYQELERVYIAKADTAGALKVIEEGRALHPENMNLIFDELNIYLNRGETSKQISKIENAIAKDPKNKTLLFVAGIAYSANKQSDKSIEAYKKALEIDPAYTDAIYNLAVIYINKGNDYITAANKLPQNKASDAKYNDLKKKFETELSNAMPLLEKARELNPKDVNTLTTLREVYIKLGKLDKATEVKKTLDQM